MKIYNKIYTIGSLCLLKVTAMLFAVLVVACSKDSDATIDNGDRPIYFAIDESDDTRAIVNDFTDFTANNFGVVAYWYPDNDITKSPTVIMENQKINVNGSGCSIDGGYKYYWTPGTWHFAAYSPWAENPSTAPVKITPPSEVFGGYTFSGTVDGQTDYMFADEEAGYYGINGDNLQSLDGSAVPMRFRHALTKVTFGLRLADATSGTNVTFNGLSLSNVRNTGSVSFVHGNGSGNALTNRNDRNRWQTMDASGALIRDRWSVDNDQTADYDIVPLSTPVNLADENEHRLDKVLYLLPQELLASGTQQMINVSYTLQIGSNTPTTHNVSIPVRDASIEQWSTNSHVHYTLTVNPPGGTASLEVNVQPWDYVEVINQFANTVGMSDVDADNDGVKDDFLRWIDGTYQSINTTENRVLVKADISQRAQFTFRIGSPLGSTWYAMLKAKRGNPSAFSLSAVQNATVTDGVALGAVGDRVTLEVVANDENPTETNEAELIFIVICNGQILSADIVTENQKNYTIIQNINI